MYDRINTLSSQKEMYSKVKETSNGKTSIHKSSIYPNIWTLYIKDVAYKIVVFVTIPELREIKFNFNE
jgi:hypothetical protein